MLELSERRTATHNSSFQKFDIPSPQTISAIKGFMDWSSKSNRSDIQFRKLRRTGSDSPIFFEELVIVRFTDIIDRNFLF